MSAEPVVSDEERVRELEELVAHFAERLTAAQEAGVSQALLLPRLMLAFRQSFGEPPAGFALPALPSFDPSAFAPPSS